MRQEELGDQNKGGYMKGRRMAGASWLVKSLELQAFDTDQREGK